MELGDVKNPLHALLTVGTGNVLINDKNAKEYLQNNESRFLRINEPFSTLNLTNTLTLKSKQEEVD